MEAQIRGAAAEGDVAITRLSAEGRMSFSR
jgi:hypothetical protein